MASELTFRRLRCLICRMGTVITSISLGCPEELMKQCVVSIQHVAEHKVSIQKKLVCFDILHWQQLPYLSPIPPTTGFLTGTSIMPNRLDLSPNHMGTFWKNEPGLSSSGASGSICCVEFIQGRRPHLVTCTELLTALKTSGFWIFKSINARQLFLIF